MFFCVNVLEISRTAGLSSLLWQRKTSKNPASGRNAPDASGVSRFNPKTPVTKERRLLKLEKTLKPRVSEFLRKELMRR
jgi:hypothetical protein